MSVFKCMIDLCGPDIMHQKWVPSKSWLQLTNNFDKNIGDW